LSADLYLYFVKNGTPFPFERYPVMPVLDVQWNQMFKRIIKIAFAAAVAGLFVFATAATPKISVPDNMQPQPQISAKGDRLPLHPKGAACSLHGWPDFERRCQFDVRRAGNEAQTVRVIALR
jgi:hypothetical protein